ncbi:unnamed protein product [Amaranthus hypochondriacus]
MGGTEEEVKQKHHDEEIKEEEKIKEKKKKDKKKEKSDENDEQVEEKAEKKEKKKKNPEDKTDPAKLKIKLEKIETKIRDLVIKKEGILKSIQEAELNATVNANKDEITLKQE